MFESVIDSSAFDSIRLSNRLLDLYEIHDQQLFIGWDQFWSFIDICYQKRSEYSMIECLQEMLIKNWNIDGHILQQERNTELAITIKYTIGDYH